MPRGRPTKYKPELCKKMIKFFDREVYKEIEIEHYKNGEIAWIDKKRVPNKLPTLIAFSKSIGVSIRTIYDWLDKKHNSFQEEFSHTFIICKELQKDFLIQSGLMGLYNPLSFKFVAVNLTDMIDKKEVERKEKSEFIIEVRHVEAQERLNLIRELKKKDADITRIDSTTIN